MNIKALAADWKRLKEAETQAQEQRRELEDQILAALNLGPFEGTKSFDLEGVTLKLTGRMNRRIDSDKLQEIAIESGLTEHLSTLFRWKPEIAAAAWKSADETVTRPLLDAITTTAGRPSFSIGE